MIGDENLYERAYCFRGKVLKTTDAKNLASTAYTYFERQAPLVRCFFFPEDVDRSKGEILQCHQIQISPCRKPWA